MTADEFLGRLEKLEERILNPVEVLRQNRQRYREVAVAIAVAVLEDHRPPTMDADEWRSQLATLARQITAKLFRLGKLQGIDVGLGNLGELLEGGKGKDTGDGDEIGLDALEHWVAAGQAGDPKAKLIDGRDTGPDGEAEPARVVAFRLRNYLRSGKAGGSLEASIREWFAQTPGLGFDAHYPQIVREWELVLGRMFYEDVVAWKRSLKL